MKLAIFDVDGTLMDSQATIVASITQAFTAEGLSLPPRTEMLGIVGLSLVKAMSVLRPDDEAERHERLALAYKQAFWSYRSDKSFPEAPVVSWGFQSRVALAAAKPYAIVDDFHELDEMLAALWQGVPA